jgi:uncharacterized protein YjiS (DUF1127 family)
MSTLLSERRQPITAPMLRDRVPAQRPSLRTSARQEPAAAVSSPPLVAPRASRSRILDLMVATLLEWLSRRVARRELATLDERMLHDIGLDAGTVDYEVRQWFWRPTRDWRD